MRVIPLAGYVSFCISAIYLAAPSLSAYEPFQIIVLIRTGIEARH